MNGSAIKPHILALFAVSLFMVASNAYAGMQYAMCNVVYMGQGLANGVAFIGVLAVGVAAALGKVSVGLALTVSLGLTVMASAFYIAAFLGFGASGC